MRDDPLALNVRIPVKVFTMFQAPAKARGIMPRELIRLVLERTGTDNLISAILDDGK